jgi:hypothetical protein
MAVRPPARKGNLKTATLIWLKCWPHSRKPKVGRLTIPAVCTDGDHPASASEREGAEGRGGGGGPPKSRCRVKFERALARIIIF